jgi:hypothetical protein
MDYTVHCKYLLAYPVENVILPALSDAAISCVTVVGDSAAFLLPVLDAMERNPNIKKLNIWTAKAMSREEAAAVARIVMRSTEFGIESCVFTDGVCEILADAVRSSPALVALSLAGLDDPAHAIVFADAVGASKTCESLMLGNMAFCDETAHAFASSFGGLKHLDLRRIEGCGPLASGIASAAGLESLHLYSGRLSAADTRTMCRALEHLALLDIYEFYIDAAEFCAALSQSRTLKYLRVHRTSKPFDTELSSAMNGLGGVVEFDLFSRDLSSSSPLATAIAESTTLRTLRIESHMDEAQVVEIVRAVGANEQIEKLRVAGSGFYGDATVYALASAVKRLGGLRRIELGRNTFFSPLGRRVLAKAIATRWRLTEVVITADPCLIIENAVERSKANGALLAFCGGLVGPRTPVREFLRKTGDHAVEHRVLGFLSPTT